MIFLAASLFKRSSLAFLIVTIIRILSIVACLLGFAAEIFVLVTSIRGVHRAERNNNTHQEPSFINGTFHSTALAVEDVKPTCGYIGSTGVPKAFGGILFFTLNQLFGILILILCFLSEFSPPFIERFFDHYFPPLGSEFGVGFIGCLEMFASCGLLSRNLGLLSDVAGWWLFVVGILNLLLGIMWGKKIRHRRSLFQAGKEYVKDVTHINDIEKGVKAGKKSLELGKKMAGKVVNISAPMPPPPTYDPATNTSPVFNGPRRVS